MDSSASANYVVQRRVEIGQNIKAWRRKRGLTQEEVARRLGCSRKRVNRAEQGYIELAMGEIELLAQTLDASFYQLIGSPPEVSA